MIDDQLTQLTNVPGELSTQSADAIARAADLIIQADSLIITAGAGMGVDSGLPDFRGKDGFWNAYPALRESGLDFFQIASPAAFGRAPALAWGFYGHRLALYRAIQPHSGFAHLLRWGQLKHKGYWVFTSNVDGQFQKAGFSPAHIHECHGSIHHMQCTECCTANVWLADGFVPEVDEARCLLRNPLPRCPHCGAVARPNILMFSDSEWQGIRSDSQTIRQEAWLEKVTRPVVIELGAGTAIPSVSYLGESICKRFGASLVRINMEEDDATEPWIVPIPMRAATALETLSARLP